MRTNQGTILIVDDDAASRALLAASLEDEGYTVQLAENGQQALERLRAATCDLVLLDLLMPTLTGFQVLEQMQADSKLEHIPVVVISAQDDVESVGRCLRMGTLDYLPKPFEPNILRMRVRLALTMKRLYDQEQEQTGNLLVVDDDALNRSLLATSLAERGYQVETAENGALALVKLRAQAFDVVLLDLVMPHMDGFEMLRHLKADSLLQHLPVIIVSAEDDMDSVVRCIEMGATDYLCKPVEAALLYARVNASLAAKRLHDQEAAYVRLIQAERQKSERLLLNILPRPIADRLKHGEYVIAESFADVTVLFADLVGFTELSARLAPQELVMLLNAVFSMFDQLAEQHGVEKIKTIGDAYMAVAGLPLPRPNHADVMAALALDMQRGLRELNDQQEHALHLRIGLHSGPVVAGIIGAQKFSYDLWGDTVNIASRMESHGMTDAIQVTAATYAHLKLRYRLEARGMIDIKGKGPMQTYLLVDKVM